MELSHRPRNVKTFQAAAILYGDWGTSKAYVLGLAFALAGYRSFWLIAAVCLLMLVVGLNYITICKFSPSGGGVYTSARKHSEVLALVGAYFLIADYLVTMALSALSCFEYLGVASPPYWAVGAIACIGLINYFGPRHSGNVALAFTLLTVFIVFLLAFFSLPYIGQAARSIQPLSNDLWLNWTHFVGMIVALSGIEAIANTTGVMVLDPGSTEERPSVQQISKRAILLVMIEVCFFTAFFGFMVNALPHLEVVNQEVLSPERENVRDFMLRYMGDYFVSHYWDGVVGGHLFGSLVGIIFAILLLSAVNTAMVALISLLFVMSRDRELPQHFQQLNLFGVPRTSLLVAALAAISILIFVHDVVGLANLYAVGFVGAIATNLGVNAADRTIPMSRLERYFMWAAFAVLIAVEGTLLFTKPEARRFVISILAFGLLARMIVAERRKRQYEGMAKRVSVRHASLLSDSDEAPIPLHRGALLCAVRNIGKTLDFAIQQAKKEEQPLYLLFIREQKVMTEEDHNRSWVEDEEAVRIFEYAKAHAEEVPLKFFYRVSHSPAETIVELAKELQVSRAILGRPRHSVLLQVLRGNIVQEVAEILPAEIDLLVIS